MPVRIVKVSKENMPSYVTDMMQKGFRCIEINSGEYSCTKRINEIQDYIVILLSAPG
ncbi:MAG: hypothetical protein QXT76_06940 [Sulfolobales archaeon]